MFLVFLDGECFQSLCFVSLGPEYTNNCEARPPGHWSVIGAERPSWTSVVWENHFCSLGHTKDLSDVNIYEHLLKMFEVTNFVIFAELVWSFCEDQLDGLLTT